MESANEVLPVQPTDFNQIVLIFGGDEFGPGDEIEHDRRAVFQFPDLCLGEQEATLRLLRLAPLSVVTALLQANLDTAVLEPLDGDSNFELLVFAIPVHGPDSPQRRRSDQRADQKNNQCPHLAVPLSGRATGRRAP